MRRVSFLVEIAPWKRCRWSSIVRCVLRIWAGSCGRCQPGRSQDSSGGRNNKIENYILITFLTMTFFIRLCALSVVIVLASPNFVHAMWWEVAILGLIWLIIWVVILITLFLILFKYNKVNSQKPWKQRVPLYILQTINIVVFFIQIFQIFIYGIIPDFVWWITISLILVPVCFLLSVYINWKVSSFNERSILNNFVFFLLLWPLWYWIMWAFNF